MELAEWLTRVGEAAGLAAVKPPEPTREGGRAWIVARGGGEELLVARPWRAALRRAGSGAGVGVGPTWRAPAEAAREVAEQAARRWVERLAAARRDPAECLAAAREILGERAPADGALVDPAALAAWLRGVAGDLRAGDGRLVAMPAVPPEPVLREGLPRRLARGVARMAAVVEQHAGRPPQHDAPDPTEVAAYADRWRLPASYRAFLLHGASGDFGGGRFDIDDVPCSPFTFAEAREVNGEEPSDTFVVAVDPDGEASFALDLARVVGDDCPVLLQEPHERVDAAESFAELLLRLGRGNAHAPRRPFADELPPAPPGWTCVAARAHPRASLWVGPGAAVQLAGKGATLEEASERSWTSAPAAAVDLLVEPAADQRVAAVRAAAAAPPDNPRGLLIAGSIFLAPFVVLFALVVGAILMAVVGLVWAILLAIWPSLPAPGIPWLWLACSLIVLAPIIYWVATRHRSPP